MAIQVGDKLPEAKFRVMTAEGLQVKTTDVSSERRSLRQ